WAVILADPVQFERFPVSKPSANADGLAKETA
ncbi:MAG: hypothetical protein QOI81_1526, partial [Actinomycetota bacterium]|nr:hypothetical protein [Actinomycetota bacterium]